MPGPADSRTAARSPWRPAVLVTGAALLILGACSGGGSGGSTAGTGSTQATGSGDASATGGTGDVTLALEPGVGASVPLAEQMTVTVSATNSGERSVTAPIELALVSPDGTERPFSRTSLFVPFGETATADVAFTTTRWTADTGEFEVRASLTDPALGTASAALAFTVAPSARTFPVFEDVTEQVGLATEVPDPECGQFANGAAWGDVDGDRKLDLVVTRLADPVQLFVQQADGTFADESTRRGVTAPGANGAAFADYDNDGDADLVLVGDGPDVLLENDGTGAFADVTAAAGIAGDPSHRGMSAAWGDYDGDGLLDLYVTNYMECTGEWTTEEEIIANVGYHADALFHNDGDGGFSDVTASLPDGDRTAAGFTAAWLDVDDDGRLDLYLANDFVGLTPDSNRLWMNAGDGSWTDDSLDSGTGLYMNTMGVGIGDVDRDGDFDMALSNIGGNKLLRSAGDGTFVEELASGIERPQQGIDYRTITWGSAFYDLDLDGWEDLFMAAGNLIQAPDVVVGEQPNMIFLNDGTGARFLDVSTLTGADDIGESKGVAFADYDGDGAIDVFVVNQAGSPRLYRNVTPRADRHWLQVALVGSTSNRDGCGAVVTAAIGADTIDRVVLCGSGGSGSAHQHAVHLGLGSATTVDSLEIAWPSGTEQVLTDVAVDRILTVAEADA